MQDLEYLRGLQRLNHREPLLVHQEGLLVDSKFALRVVRDEDWRRHLLVIAPRSLLVLQEATVIYRVSPPREVDPEDHSIGTLRFKFSSDPGKRVYVGEQYLVCLLNGHINSSRISITSTEPLVLENLNTSIFAIKRTLERLQTAQQAPESLVATTV